MNLIRKIRFKFTKVYYPYTIRKKAKQCGKKLYCGGKSYVNSNTYLGEHVCFNGMAISGNGKVTIGDYFHSGINCQIITSFHNYEGEEIPYDNTYIDKDVNIGDCVWLGNNVIILGGVNIGEGAIIQAGSVVCCDVPPFAIAGGHPAKQFKTRNIENYLKKKSENRFH